MSNVDLMGDDAEVVEQEHKRVGRPKKALSSRVRILLESPADGSTQHFFGVNGKGYLLKFDEPVSVPRELLSVLDEAVQTKVIPVDGGGFVERSFKRFPYRILSEGG